MRKSAGPEAVQVTVESPAAPAAVADYYRGVFKRGTWRLVNEAKDASGATVLLAEQDGPPLWVRIRPSGATGSVVELSGAVVSKADSAAAEAGVLTPAHDGSSMSSNRRIRG